MTMYLVDTDVISEGRKGDKGNPGVRQFFQDAERNDIPLYLSAVTIGELRQGVESVSPPGDEPQAAYWTDGLNRVTGTFQDAFLRSMGRLPKFGSAACPNPENPLDKQNRRTALINDLTS